MDGRDHYRNDGAYALFELWTKVEMGGIDMRELTVKELREALVGVPGDLPVRLSSDTGVDQGYGYIIIEKACRVKYGSIDYFDIYANDYAEEG